MLKKIKVILLLATFILPIYASAEEYIPFNDKNMNVVFLGGSITQGTGASSEDKIYAKLVYEYLKTKYSDKNVNYFNAGLGGTGSDIGVYRLATEVINHNPDLVFVEFVVNDNDMEEQLSLESMEGIVRVLLRQKKIPKIIFLYTTKETLDMRTEINNKVADYYNIPVIDIQQEVKRQVKYGMINNINDIFVDGVHPNDSGYKIYADYIIKKLKDSRIFVPPVKREVPLSGVEFVSPKTIDMTTVVRKGNWKQVNVPYSEDIAWESSTPGDSLELEFGGNFIGGYNIMGRGFGKADYVIDDIIKGTLDFYYDVGDMKGAALNVKGLPDGKHKIVITVSQDKNSNSIANRVAICGFRFDDGDKTDLYSDKKNEEVTQEKQPEINVTTKSASRIFVEGIKLNLGESFAVINDKKVSVDRINPMVKPIYLNNQILLPIRFIVENFGGKVRIDLTDNSYVYTRNNEILQYYLDSTRYVLDDEEQFTSQAPIQLNGTSYIPFGIITSICQKNAIVSYKGNILIYNIDDELTEKMKQELFTLMDGGE